MNRYNGFVDSDFKETAIGLIPQDWDISQLKELAINFFGGGTPSRKRPEYWNGDIAWVTSAYIDDNLYLATCTEYITQSGLDNSSTKLVPKGNILIGTRVGIGKATINVLDTAISQDLTAMIVDCSKVCVKYIVFALKSQTLQQIILSGARGTTIKGITRADLVQLPIPLPPLTEQRRIASALEAIQDEIAMQDELIEKAQEFKHSLMQRLFTYGVNEEPTETKETEIGEIPTHWEYVKLADIAKIERGKFSHRPRNDPAYYGGKIPFIQTGDVSNANGRVTDYSQTLNELGLSVSRIFPAGTIVITIAANIGFSAILDFDSAFPDSLVGITPYEGIDATYLHYYLQTQQERMDALASRGTQKNINIKFLEPYPAIKPPISEQKAIANALFDVDNKIAVEEDRKSALEEFFKSILHQLMTGKIRLLSDEGLDIGEGKGISNANTT